MPTGDVFEAKKYPEGDHDSQAKYYPWGNGNNVIILWASVTTAGTGTATITMEDSADGQNWSFVATPIASFSLAATSVQRGTVTASTPFGSNVMFKLNITSGGYATMGVQATFKVK